MLMTLSKQTMDATKHSPLILSPDLPIPPSRHVDFVRWLADRTRNSLIAPRPPRLVTPAASCSILILSAVLCKLRGLARVVRWRQLQEAPLGVVWDGKLVHEGTHALGIDALTAGKCL